MKKKGLLIGLLSLLLTVAGIGIRMLYRHPDRFEKPISMDSVITFQDVDYSIVNVKIVDSYGEETIRDGYEYFVITIKIVNNSDKKLDSNNDLWDLQGKSGKMDVTLVPVYSIVPYEIINPKESGEIEIAFEKKIGVIPTKLSYYKNSNDAKGPAFVYGLE